MVEPPGPLWTNVDYPLKDLGDSLDHPGSIYSEIDHVAEQRRRIKILAGLLAALILSLGVVGCVLTQPMPFTSPGKGPSTVDPAHLEAHVRWMVGVPRHHRNPRGLEQVADYVIEGFRRAGARVSPQPFQVDGQTYRNVIGSFGPETGPRIIVGAHYDTFGNLPGADDNASAVAGLLELARLLQAHTPPLRVDLVAYTLEEPPFFRTQDMGSARHAQAMKDEGHALKAVIVLEMIGRFDDAPGSQHYPPLVSLFYPNRGNFIAVVGRFSDLTLTRKLKKAMRQATPLPVVSINGPRSIPGLDFSDHHPYWDRGFGAVMVTDTAFNRNRDYHTPRDTPERLDYRRMAQVVQGVHAGLQALMK